MTWRMACHAMLCYAMLCYAMCVCVYVCVFTSIVVVSYLHCREMIENSAPLHSVCSYVYTCECFASFSFLFFIYIYVCIWCNVYFCHFAMYSTILSASRSLWQRHDGMFCCCMVFALVFYCRIFFFVNIFGPAMHIRCRQCRPTTSLKQRATSWSPRTSFLEETFLQLWPATYIYIYVYIYMSDV